MSPTLEQVARLAGVAKSTASMTLRDHPSAQRFSLETRQRILATAKRLKYQPNFFASQLSSPQRKVLMFGLSHLCDHWASLVADGFEREASSRGYRILLTAFQHKEDPIAFSREVLGSRGIPALAVVGGDRTRFTDDAIRQLADEGVKIVTVNRPVGHERVSEIAIDNYRGGVLGASHLYGLGVSQLWLVVGSPNATATPFQSRIQGVMDEAARRGKPEPRLVQFIGEKNWLERARGAMAQALCDGRPDGVFAMGDIFAVGACHALRGVGLEIGRDVPVVGFDGGIYSQTHYPPLTSIYQPAALMGKSAAQLLIDAVEDQACPARQRLIQPDLLLAESTTLRQAVR